MMNKQLLSLLVAFIFIGSGCNAAPVTSIAPVSKNIPAIEQQQVVPPTSEKAILPTAEVSVPVTPPSTTVKVAAPAPAPAPIPATTPTPTLAPVPAPNGTYVNTNGNVVPSPYSAPQAPIGATAQCRDNTYSFSQNRSGTCSHHGGVANWL